MVMTRPLQAQAPQNVTKKDPWKRFAGDHLLFSVTELKKSPSYFLSGINGEHEANAWQRLTAISQANRDRMGVRGYMSLSDSPAPTFINYDVMHMISRTRPSCFTTCNIDKAGNRAWGRG